MITSLFGMTCLIAGTTIGAGMLALPLTLGVFSLPIALSIMAAAWAFMYIAGLLNIRMIENAGQPCSLATMTQTYFHKGFALVTFWTLAIFLMSLLTAYLSGATSLLKNLLGLAAADTILMLVLTCLLAVLLAMSHRVIDHANRILFILMIGIFAVMIGPMLQLELSTPPTLVLDTVFTRDQVRFLALSIPVLVTAFGSHPIIPSFVKMAGGDTTLVRKGLLWGSLLALLLYASWVIGCAAALRDTTLHARLLKGNLTLGELTGAISQLSHFDWFMITTWSFSILAILTSFIGVSMALKGLLSELFARANRPWLGSELFLSVATFGPPVGICLVHSNIFTHALAAAGSYLTVIAVILPLLILRKQETPHSTSMSCAKRLGAYGLIALSMLIIGCELLSLIP